MKKQIKENLDKFIENIEKLSRLEYSPVITTTMYGKPCYKFHHYAITHSIELNNISDINKKCIVADIIIDYDNIDFDPLVSWLTYYPKETNYVVV